MKIKPAVIVTVTDGIPNCYACGDFAQIHEEFRAIKKAGWQGFEEAYELNARGIDGRAKFKKPEQPTAPAKTTRKKKTDA